MPRRVDHEQRRHDIAEAVWRLIEQGGLENVTPPKVATEAGISARKLEDYFGSRDYLLLGTLEILNADAERQADRRMDTLDPPPNMREIVRDVLHELLPLDDERHTRYTVRAAYFSRILTEPRFAAVAESTGPSLEDAVTELLDEAKRQGEVIPHVDTTTEAALLVAAAEGLKSAVLLGQRTPADAAALLDHQLDRLFIIKKVTNLHRFRNTRR
jgi:AcrR family transcriptional regulator